MGTQGVKLNFDKSLLTEVIKRNKGVIKNIQKDLKCCNETVHNYINADPELVDLLARERNGYVEELMDEAEDTLKYAIANREKDLTNALKATFYSLNNHGRKRGYSRYEKAEEQEIDAEGEATLAHVKLMEEAKKFAKKALLSRGISLSDMEIEQSLSHQGQGGSQGSLSTQLGAEGTPTESPQL